MMPLRRKYPIFRVPLKIEAPPNVDALIVGGPTLEGGDISVYGDAAGRRSLWFDADDAYLELVGIPPGYAMLALAEDPDWNQSITLYARNPRISLSDALTPASTLLLAARDEDALRLGHTKIEGGNISVYRDALGNRQLFLDADALENALAMTLFGRLRVGATDPVEVRGDAGNIVRANTGALFCKIATGTYTGDGTESQAITGVGFRPKFVHVARIHEVVGSTYALYKTDRTATTWAIYVDNAFTYDNRIISLDEDGFTVDDEGVDNDPNKTGVPYEYLALG